MYIHGCSEFASHYASLSWHHGVLNAGRQLLVSTSAVQASTGFSEHLPSFLPSPCSLQPYHDLQKRGGERERVGEGGEGRRGEV